MPAKKQQTHAKRARELAVKEKRERKRLKKAERAAAAEGLLTNEDGSVVSLEAPQDEDESGVSPETPQDESAEAAVPAPAPVEAR
jgi:hypothetical protein